MAGNNLSFQLDTQAAQVILTDMAMPLVEQSANAIMARATNMAASISKNPPSFDITTRVGVIRRGTRAIASVSVVADDAHAQYVGRMALTKAKDAGRV